MLKWLLIKWSILFLFLLQVSIQISFGQKIQVNGFVKDKESGEALINAHIFDSNSLKGTITNAYGFFSLPVSDTIVFLKVSYVGYKNQIISFKSVRDTTINIEMENENLIDEVEIREIISQQHSINRSTGNIYLTGKELESIPGMLGERDLLKSLQLIPGIQQGREGLSGIFVRGGDQGQNLILLDGVPVYNVNHLWGVFSVFTPEAVKSVDVYKGGFPARYGGKLSSVVDIRMKEGNLNNTRYDFTIGTAAIKAMIEGPIVKGKSSYLISARRTYADLFYTPIKRLLVYHDRETTVKSWNGYYFYDINAKVNFSVSKTSRIYLSAYSGKDQLFIREKMEKQEQIASGSGVYQENLSYTNNFSNSWGNITSSLRWNKIINPRFFANTTITYSTYKYQYGNDYKTEEVSVYDTISFNERFLNLSGISNLGAAIDLDYYFSSKYSLKFGTMGLFNSYLPGKYINNFQKAGNEPVKTVLFGENYRTTEFSIYAENHIGMTQNLSANIGVNGLFYTAEDFSTFSLQPRILLNYTLTRELTFKTGYSRMSQPLHLLVNNGASYPVDIWVPAVKAFGPADAHQLEFGTYYSKKQLWELSTEIYWKTMNGVLNYRNGESFFYLNENWESKVTKGKGYSYGLEALLKKNAGKSTGWFGYNLAWTFRQFNDLNYGKAFPFRYDTRHRLNVVFIHKLKENIDFSATWIFATGAPVTLSETAYDSEEVYKNVSYGGTLEDYLNIYNPPRAPGKAIYYSGLNNYRLPNYHRLDVGINFSKKKKFGQRIWNVSVYNLYNRNNPFFLTYKMHDEAFHTQVNGVGEYKNFSFFGFLPSVSYRLIID